MIGAGCIASSSQHHCVGLARIALLETCRNHCATFTTASYGGGGKSKRLEAAKSVKLRTLNFKLDSDRQAALCVAEDLLDHSSVWSGPSSPRFVLGLDVNTNMTGWTVLRCDDESYVSSGLIDTRKQKDPVEIGGVLHAALVNNVLADALESSRDLVIGVEGYLKTFGHATFQTRGLFALAETNAICRYVCHNVFGLIPLVIHPNTPRSMFGVRGNDIKEAVLEFVRPRVPSDFVWPANQYRFDLADSHLIGLCARREYAKSTLLESDNALKRFRERFSRSVAQGDTAASHLTRLLLQGSWHTKSELISLVSICGASTLSQKRKIDFVDALMSPASRVHLAEQLAANDFIMASLHSVLVSEWCTVQQQHNKQE